LRRHLGSVGLYLVTARFAPHDEPNASRGGVPERHRRTGFGSQRGTLYARFTMFGQASAMSTARHFARMLIEAVIMALLAGLFMRLRVG
jgi:hypothetical protein